MSTITDAFALAWQHHQAGRFTSAEQLYRQILSANPLHADSWCFLGALQQSQGNLLEAEANFRRAVEILPTHPSAPNCLGIALAQLGRLDEATEIFEKLLNQNPDDAEVQNNLGLVYYKKERFDEAMICYRRALALRPTFADAHNNLANALNAKARLPEALTHYDEAIRLNPQFAEAYFNRATPRLLQGDFLGGWSDYEWRWRRPAYRLPPLRQPFWNGRPLPGKTILLWSEQGLGDTLQFIRYAPLVKECCAKLALACQPALQRLLATCPGIDQIIPKDKTPLPDFDTYVPLLSLPAVFKTTLATLPPGPPYLAADRDLVAQWRRKLDQLTAPNTLRIGIAWQGSVAYPGDRHRSLPLSYFEPLSRLPNVQLISLQKGTGSEQLEQVKDCWPILEWTDALDESTGAFQDTAAIMRNLDLVITSDSAVAHLAGALATQVWLATPWLPDFRWFLGRDDCPWYPSMRLFRQATRGSWEDVLEKMAQAISEGAVHCHQVREALNAR